VEAFDAPKNLQGSVFCFLGGWMDGWWGKHSMGFSSHGRHGRLKAQQKE
jgi:hypothetical protein